MRLPTSSANCVRLPVCRLSLRFWWMPKKTTWCDTRLPKRLAASPRTRSCLCSKSGSPARTAPRWSPKAVKLLSTWPNSTFCVLYKQCNAWLTGDPFCVLLVKGRESLIMLRRDGILLYSGVVLKCMLSFFFFFLFFFFLLPGYNQPRWPDDMDLVHWMPGILAIGDDAARFDWCFW